MADPVSRLEEALAEIAGTAVELERPADPGHGDYATNVALRLSGTQRRPAREIAEELAERMLGNGVVADAEAAGPGFVNLRVSDVWLVGALSDILAAGEAFGAASAEVPERIQVELVSANPTGPLTVAHARNGAYGDSVGRLLEFAGHDLEREYYCNDAGTQIEQFYASVEAVRRGEEPPEDGYQGDYIQELARLDEDPVPAMLRQIEASLERFRIHLDSWARQSEFVLRVAELLPRLDTYESEGAVWARSSAYGDEQDRVLVRSTGEPTYRAADVPYVDDKLTRGFDRAIYVLGADHHGTRKWYAAVARMLGYDPSRIEVLLYQLVHLVERGEAKRMSKRRGDVVFLDDLLDAIGVDAARWYLVSRGPDQAIEIDVDLAAERTQKNPVYYVQYAHARIAGILRNAVESRDGLAASARVETEEKVGSDETEDRVLYAEPESTLSGEERDLIKRLLEFPALVAEATERRAPQAIPTYAIRVADDFHRFYHENRVLGSKSQAFRLALCRGTQLVVARCLDLIGVEAPERM